MHFLKPGFYLAIMPSWVPRPLAMVYFTGACEVLGGLGLLIAPLRPAAGFLALRLPLQAVLVWWVYRAGLSG